MNQINWKFIAAREGTLLHGYVPDPLRSHSGVTIATGFDIGNASADTIAKLSPALAAKLDPYHGLTRLPALHMLQLNPLTITVDEANEIDQLARQGTIAELEAKYSADAGTPFDSLPEPAQTVIASVTFQYGIPWSKTPRFWRHCIEQDWKAMYADLMNFGDKYPARRKLEAAYLSTLI
jgi:hypothetical protein